MAVCTAVDWAIDEFFGDVLGAQVSAKQAVERKSVSVCVCVRLSTNFDTHSSGESTKACLCGDKGLKRSQRTFFFEDSETLPIA